MIKCLQEFVWFMACLIYDFIRYWRRHIQVCLRTIGVSFLDYHLLYPLSEQCRVLSISWTIAVCCMGRDGPRPGASINIQVGSSLTKGGGGQTKNSGKLLSMYIEPHTILASFEYLIHLVVTVVIKTLDKWETDWTLEPLKCRWKEVGASQVLLLNEVSSTILVSSLSFTSHCVSAFRQHGILGTLLVRVVHRLHKHGSGSHSFRVTLSSPPPPPPPPPLGSNWLIKSWVMLMMVFHDSWQLTSVVFCLSRRLSLQEFCNPNDLLAVGVQFPDRNKQFADGLRLEAAAAQVELEIAQSLLAQLDIWLFCDRSKSELNTSDAFTFV